MINFLTKLLMFLGVVLLLIVVIPNPLHLQFPRLIKSYMDYQGKKPDMMDFNELEIVMEDPRYCNQNSDCVLELCGKGPNCDSKVMNKEYAENGGERLKEFSCPETPSVCAKEVDLKMYAACEKHTCVKQKLFPTPAPKKSIFEVN